MINWLVNFLIKQVLVRFGVSSTLAALLAPRVIKVMQDAAAIAKELKSKGVTNEHAVNVADEVVLRPRAPEQVFEDRLTEIGG